MTRGTAGRISRYVSVPWDRCRLLRVMAEVQTGVAMPAWFPLPLDGILAQAARRRRLGGSYGRVVDHHVDRTGLHAKVVRGGPWVWTASCATPVGAAVEDVQWVHKRFRANTAETVVDKLPANTDVGLTKGWRIPVVVTACRSLTWRAIGDPDEVRDLLTDVTVIGKKWGTGQGMVLKWVVTDLGPIPHGASALDWLLRGPGDRIARPVVAHRRTLDHLGLPADVDTIPHTHRPPYWRPNQAHGTDRFTRQYRDVIAPWVQLPPLSTSETAA